MDEPFAALDAQTREQLQDELLRIWKPPGKTIVFITHGIDEAVYLGQRVAVLSARPGRLKEIVDIDLGDRDARTAMCGPTRRSSNTGTRSGRCCMTRSAWPRTPATARSGPTGPPPTNSTHGRGGLMSHCPTAGDCPPPTWVSRLSPGPRPGRLARRRARGLLGGRRRGVPAVVLFLLLWELGPTYLASPATRVFLPPLHEVLTALGTLAANGQLADHLAASLARSASGFGIAVVTAIALGLLVAWYPALDSFLSPLLELFRNTAALALLPVFTLLLGIGEELEDHHRGLRRVLPGAAEHDRRRQDRGSAADPGRPLARAIQSGCSRRSSCPPRCRPSSPASGWPAPRRSWC